MKLVKSLAAIAFLFAAVPANAEFFSCHFTEPFISVYASTTAKVFSESHYGTQGAGFKITSIQKKSDSLVLKVSNGKTMEIFRNKVGSDGMSDLFYPYDVKYGNLWGGCESEKVVENTLVERRRTFREKTGMSLVNYWPGEYGYVMGYKAKNKVTIPAESTWSSFLDSKVGEDSCTLPKGKYVVHARQQRFERYVHYWPTHKFVATYDSQEVDLKKGDEVTLVAYGGEGYCLVEKGNESFFMSCPDYKMKTNEDGGKDYGEISPYGNYAFLKCEEGHYAWINENVFDTDDKNFQFVNLGF